MVLLRESNINRRIRRRSRTWSKQQRHVFDILCVVLVNYIHPNCVLKTSRVHPTSTVATTYRSSNGPNCSTNHWPFKTTAHVLLFNFIRTWTKSFARVNRPHGRRTSRDIRCKLFISQQKMPVQTRWRFKQDGGSNKMAVQTRWRF